MDRRHRRALPPARPGAIRSPIRVRDTADVRAHRRGGAPALALRPSARPRAATPGLRLGDPASPPAGDHRHRAHLEPRRVHPRRRPDRAAAGDRRGRGPERRPATSRPASTWPATTSSPASPRATIGSPATSSGAIASSAGSRRHRPQHAAPGSRLARRAGGRGRARGLRAGRCRGPLVDPATVRTEERVPGEPRPGAGRPARRRRADRRPPRPRAGHADVGAGRPGPPRAVRQRDRGRHPQRPAVRPGRGPERPAPRARRRQGRLPARRQPQPPDAADEHPGLRRAAGPERPPTDAWGSSPSRPSGCRGWSASC